MNRKRYFPLIVVALLAIGSCKKDKKPILPDPTKLVVDTNKVTVYVVGYARNSAGVAVATIWRNGKATYLGDSTIYSIASAIAISGIDVYVGGEVRGSDQQLVGTYWKNGTPVSLTSGLTNAAIFAVAAQGTDVYVAGEVTPFDTAAGTADYWKNGNVVQISNDPTGSIVNAIAINGNDVYAAGTQDTVGHLWKNGIATRLENGATKFIPSSIAIDNNGNVFIAGVIRDNGGAAYWSNGTITNLPVGSFVSQANAIAVRNDTLYMAGFSDLNKPCYWTNGKITPLPQSSFLTYPTGIAVQGSDVYVSGQIGDGAAMWVNGVAVKLNQHGVAYGIAVVPR